MKSGCSIKFICTTPGYKCECSEKDEIGVCIYRDNGYCNSEAARLIAYQETIKDDGK